MGVAIVAPPDVRVHAMAVDPSIGTGDRNRMGASFQYSTPLYPEMSSVDARYLTWTTDPLEAELVVAGTPKVTFHATSTAAGAVFVVWLEDVDTKGRSTLVTYGSLKASRRALGVAPYDTGRARWHPAT